MKFVETRLNTACMQGLNAWMLVGLLYTHYQICVIKEVSKTTLMRKWSGTPPFPLGTFYRIGSFRTGFLSNLPQWERNHDRFGPFRSAQKLSSSRGGSEPERSGSIRSGRVSHPCGDARADYLADWWRHSKGSRSQHMGHSHSSIFSFSSFVLTLPVTFAKVRSTAPGKDWRSCYLLRSLGTSRRASGLGGLAGDQNASSPTPVGHHDLPIEVCSVIRHHFRRLKYHQKLGHGYFYHFVTVVWPITFSLPARAGVRGDRSPNWAGRDCPVGTLPDQKWHGKNPVLSETIG